MWPSGQLGDGTDKLCWSPLEAVPRFRSSSLLSCNTPSSLLSPASSLRRETRERGRNAAVDEDEAAIESVVAFAAASVDDWLFKMSLIEAKSSLSDRAA